MVDPVAYGAVGWGWGVGGSPPRPTGGARRGYWSEGGEGGDSDDDDLSAWLKGRKRRGPRAMLSISDAPNVAPRAWQPRQAPQPAPHRGVRPFSVWRQESVLSQPNPQVALLDAGLYGGRVHGMERRAAYRREADEVARRGSAHRTLPAAARRSRSAALEPYRRPVFPYSSLGPRSVVCKTGPGAGRSRVRSRSCTARIYQAAWHGASGPRGGGAGGGSDARRVPSCGAGAKAVRARRNSGAGPAPAPVVAQRVSGSGSTTVTTDLQRTQLSQEIRKMEVLLGQERAEKEALANEVVEERRQKRSLARKFQEQSGRHRQSAREVEEKEESLRELDAEMKKLRAKAKLVELLKARMKRLEGEISAAAGQLQESEHSREEMREAMLRAEEQLVAERELASESLMVAREAARQAGILESDSRPTSAGTFSTLSTATSPVPCHDVATAPLTPLPYCDVPTPPRLSGAAIGPTPSPGHNTSPEGVVGSAPAFGRECDVGVPARRRRRRRQREVWQLDDARLERPSTSQPLSRGAAAHQCDGLRPDSAPDSRMERLEEEKKVAEERLSLAERRSSLLQRANSHILMRLKREETRVQQIERLLEQERSRATVKLPGQV